MVPKSYCIMHPCVGYLLVSSIPRKHKCHSNKRISWNCNLCVCGIFELREGKMKRYGLLISVLFNALFVAYITYLRIQYDRSKEEQSAYQIQRDSMSIKLDSATEQYSKLEGELKLAQKKEASWKNNYDSLKVEFNKKQNANTVKNKPILYYNIVQLDSFWANYRFRHNN